MCNEQVKIKYLNAATVCAVCVRLVCCVSDWMHFEVNEEGQLKDRDDPPPRRSRVNSSVTVRPNARHVDRGGQV